MQSAILPMYLRAKSVTVLAVVGKPKVGEIQPIKEGKMFNKRLFLILVAVPLLVVAAFIFETGTAISTVVSNPDAVNPIAGAEALDHAIDYSRMTGTHLPSAGKEASDRAIDYSRMTGTYFPITGGEASDRTIDYSRMTGTYLPMQAF
jgi:hypothetical protein